MNSKYSKLIKSCQISKKKDLKNILSLGYLPPVNKLVKIGHDNQEIKFFSTNLVFSESSRLAQLDTIVDKEILFPKEYPYTSSTTKILRENFQNLYQECSKILRLKKNDLIIDIGSNDGNLLSNFVKKHKVLGVTPENIGKIARKKGIRTIIDYFSTKISKKILKQYGAAKVITATNVFAHIDDLSELLKNIKRILDKDGVFVTESHYFLNLIETLQYDTIYHEHLRYYSLQSLKFLFDKYNLEIFHAKQIPTHGGSIRVYAAHKGKFKKTKSVKIIEKKEKNSLNWKNFKKFKFNVIQSKIKINKILLDIKKKNKTVFGIGAPSRASTLINYTGINENLVSCVCEIDGSYKIGNYMPGTDIPIVSEKKLYKDKPEYVILFSWHIAKELKINLKKRGFKGKFILPLPFPRIEK
ncbi:class I SAM-dependent methyltransferase [Pelagibacteraceae bacterium]|mgnify:CR=1 FL=1|jgi:SAM-dependent methyltransferase|nr:class I SAM-dependent methyltransferase [Pelagibacteraceae bacterium]|tara:strand:- start:30 stop:1268 length:1239 start_codon:yes stop_codon:yes gene_type:complete